jgi:acyl-CoA synthetase (AMP-forming)/AMP-acid ligase II
VNAIVEQFERLWREAPARPLIHLPSSGNTLTADDLQRTRHVYAAAIDRAGLENGHIILSVTGNRPGFFALLLAAWSVGAVVMPVDEDTRDHEIDQLAEQFGVAAVVRARSGHASAGIHFDDALTIELRSSDTWQRHAGLALFKVTSGSSGVPKAVAVPPAAMLNDTAHITTAMGITPADTQIAVIPLSHAYGFGNLVLPLLLQGSAIVLRNTFIPEMVIADALRYRARIMPGVPFMFHHYVTHPPPEGWPAVLSCLISAGARLAPEVVRAFYDKFGVKVRSFYGATESGGIAFDHGDQIDDVPAVGWPLPGVTVELRDDEGVPEGCGRVFVRSNAVARGYVCGSVEEPFDGFLTGDYGTISRDGRLLLAGRVSTFINVAGRKVQPAEIEQVLRLMPDVIDASVLAVADPARGEQVGAVVAGNGTLSPSAVRQFCINRLPRHKVPRVVVVVHALPLTARGKPDPRALQALVNAALV